MRWSLRTLPIDGRLFAGAAVGLLKEFGALREFTGRGRYRAWGIV
ncbi:MAG: helix-turn-helix domain-containing protein [Microvirga sp.]